MVSLSKFAENLKYLIEDSEITHKELSEGTGIDGASITRYLKGNCEPTVKAIVALADYFNCSVDFLLGLTDEKALTGFLPCPPIEERINYYYNLSGLSGYELCKKAHLPDSRFYHWLDGSHKPSISSIENFANYSKCTLDEFLGRVK